VRGKIESDANQKTPATKCGTTKGSTPNGMEQMGGPQTATWGEKTPGKGPEQQKKLSHNPLADFLWEDLARLVQ